MKWYTDSEECLQSGRVEEGQEWKSDWSGRSDWRDARDIEMLNSPNWLRGYALGEGTLEPPPKASTTSLELLGCTTASLYMQPWYRDCFLPHTLEGLNTTHILRHRAHYPY